MNKTVLFIVKKTFIFILGFFSFAVVTCSASKTYAITVFQANAEALGFNISSEYVPLYMGGFKEMDFERKNNGDEHYTQVYQVLMVNQVDSSLKAFAYRVLTSPKQLRNWGFMGIGSYGNDYFNYDVITTMTFPFDPELYSILSYAPLNQPSSSTIGIGVGLSPSGPSISASVSFNHSELNVYSDTSTNDRIYKTRYEYRIGPFDIEISSYLKHEVMSYGMMIFRKEGTVWIDVTHHIQYMQGFGFDKTTADGLVIFSRSY